VPAFVFLEAAPPGAGEAVFFNRQIQTLGAGCCEFVGIGVIATAIDVDFGEGDP